MYKSGPSQEELELLGITLDEIEGIEPPDPWPEHEKAYLIFDKMRTQWYVGMAGPTGMNYANLPLYLRRYGVTDDEFDDVFDQLHILEREALWVMYEQSKDRNKKH